MQYAEPTMRFAHVLVAACSLSVAGCSTSDAESVPSATGASTAPSDSVAVPAATVVWPSASEISQATLFKLPTQAREVVARSPVPVLVVDDDRMLARATVMAKPHWYALSTQVDDVTVSLHATRAVRRYPHIQVKPRPVEWSVRGRAARVSNNEGIWSVAWREGIVAYSLDVECANPTAPRCSDPSYLMQLSRRLAFVGGVEVSN